MATLYMYRMTDDSGLAPCVENGLLSLACCKGGQIRNGKVVNTGLRHLVGKRYFKGQKDDVYIVGTYQDKLLYCARVTDVITMGEYYSGMSKGRTDDIYCIKNGKLERNNHLYKERVHIEDYRVIKDLAGLYVLLSDDYIYLGRDAVHVDVLDEYNPKYQETKTYTGEKAEKIISACLKQRDEKNHAPTKPFPKKGGCR